MSTASRDERFALLYSWSPRIRPLVIALVGAQDADDVLQQTYLNVWRVLPHTEVITFTWLRTIASNAAMDALRRLATRSSHLSPIAVDDYAEFLEAPAREAPDVIALGRERLEHYLAGFSAEDAHVLVLAAGSPRAYCEVAKDTDKSAAAVSGCVYRARKKLRELAAADAAQDRRERMAG